MSQGTGQAGRWVRGRRKVLMNGSMAYWHTNAANALVGCAHTFHKGRCKCVYDWSLLFSRNSFNLQNRSWVQTRVLVFFMRCHGYTAGSKIYQPHMIALLLISLSNVTASRKYSLNRKQRGFHNVEFSKSDICIFGSKCQKTLAMYSAVDSFVEKDVLSSGWSVMWCLYDLCEVVNLS